MKSGIKAIKEVNTMMLRMHLNREVKLCEQRINIILEIIEIEGLISYRTNELLWNKYNFKVRRAIALKELKILPK